jgi:predicted SAM-dependent methyltransferase
MKLNLGCGPKMMDGFVNVDMANNYSQMQPDVVCDITGPLPFDDVDEIHAYHVLEHLVPFKVADVLTEWKRALKPGGLLVIEVPCFDKIMKLYAHKIIDGKGIGIEWKYWLWGDPRFGDEKMLHRWCFGVEELGDILHRIGFENVQLETPQTHIKERDMRMTAVKP